MQTIKGAGNADADGQAIRASGYSLEKAVEQLNAKNPENLMIYNMEHMIAI